MTRLKTQLVNLLAAHGPISVAEFMTMCLYHPTHGYYMSREPFGVDGDFTTAPEISQMFGELVGVWIAQAWTRLGSAAGISIAEIGPGRGTLMKDMTRAIAKVAPDLSDVARFSLIEVSPRLRNVQAETLAGAGQHFEWLDTVDALPDLPLIIVGNEIFDAIPMRQYVRAAGQWRERMVGLDDDGNLAFFAGMGSVDAELLPAGAQKAPERAVVELSPARSALMDSISARIAANGGAGLFIDYGYAQPAIGDTLQALYQHRYDDILAHPGEADLTSHVDFAALADVAKAHGLETGLIEQGQFLLAMGLLDRAGRLGSGAGQEVQQRIGQDVERLAGPDQMGALFKVLCVAHTGTMPPPFTHTD